MLRVHGEEQSVVWSLCKTELEAKNDFDSRFLVLDRLLRSCEGEMSFKPPAPDPEENGEPADANDCKASPKPSEKESPQKKTDKTPQKKTEELSSKKSKTSRQRSEKDSPQNKTEESPQNKAEEQTPEKSKGEAGEPPVKKPKVDLASLKVEVQLFAKYKRLKEALKLYAERFEEDVFEKLVPSILSCAQEIGAAPLDNLKSTGCLLVQVSQARSLLANMVLLNVHGFKGLQDIMLSSAKSAPQKLLCLLTVFRADPEVAQGGRELRFERRTSKSEVPPLSIAMGDGLSLGKACFQANFAVASEGTDAAIVSLSKPDSFGIVDAVKTPPEEVLLWEMPELLCLRPLLGDAPLGLGEVFIVTGLRRFCRCTVDGPMLSWASEVQDRSAIAVAALDVPRHQDTKRFSLEVLEAEVAKWVNAFSTLAGRAVAVAHPPFLGVDLHCSFAVQLSCAAGSGADLRYSLGHSYATGGVTSAGLSVQQAKEAKHLEALSQRMRKSDWKAGEVLALIALYPFGRSRETEKFHAFWTRRLRDSSALCGRPSSEEMESLRERQTELWKVEEEPAEENTVSGDQQEPPKPAEKTE